MYKKITDVISAEVSEARNTTAKNASILIAGIQNFEVGDDILLVQKIGNIPRYFPLFVKEVAFENGNTKLICEDLLQQVFDLLLPDMPDQSGEASQIIKTILNTANSLGFVDVYVDDKNIDNSGVSYTKVNVSKRKIGELFQDICTDTGFIMWIGYDEVDDKPNAFFFKNEANFEETSCVLKEGINIIDEDLNKGSKDDIINYVLFYYYPTRYPFSEDWTEGGIGKKLWYSDAEKQAKTWYHTREVRIRNTKAYCYLTADINNQDTVITVNSTTNFTNSGYLDIGGRVVVAYSSRDATHFYLSAPIDLPNGLTATNDCFIYERRENPTDPSLAEYASITFPVFKNFPLTRMGVNVFSKSGTPGALVIRFFNPSTNKFEKKYAISNPVQGWNYVDIDFSVNIDWTFCTVYVSVDDIHTDNDYYTLSMGACLSATGQLNDGEFWHWQAYGAPSNLGEDDIFAFADPKQMLSFYFESVYNTQTPLWQGTAKIGDNCKYLSWEGREQLFRKEGTDALRLIGQGNAVLALQPLVISDFDRIHLWRYGAISRITLNCDIGGYYYKNFSTGDNWTEETIKINELSKAGNTSQVITSIKIDCDVGNGFVDSLYFLYPSSGLSVIVKDDASIAKYHQRPQVISGKGIVSSSYALSLAQKIVDNNKELKWKGRITTIDNFELSCRNSIRVIVPSKGIDEIMGIYQITHKSDGTAELEVGEFVFDYAKILARLNSQIQNLEIAVGSSTSETQESLSLYFLHALKHQSGGEDEINVQGLFGVLNDEQKTNWSLVSSKPSSSTSDIDDAVSKKHTHSNKALLDTYTQTEANLADAVNKKHEHTNKTILDSIPKTNYSGSGAPTTNDDSSKGYAVGSRWIDTTNNDEYVCLNAATGSAVWKKTT